MIHGGEGFAGAPREDETLVPDDARAKGRGFLAPLERTYSPMDTRSSAGNIGDRQKYKRMSPCEAVFTARSA